MNSNPPEYPVLKTEPYLEDEDSITADIKSNKKFKMDPDFYPEDDFIDVRFDKIAVYVPYLFYNS